MVAIASVRVNTHVMLYSDDGMCQKNCVQQDRIEGRLTFVTRATDRMMLLKRS